jgi:hypothetical protein
MEKMARYWEIAEEAMREIRARRELEKTGEVSGLPWRDYHGGKQFWCEHCGTRFDTSVGHAWHVANSCQDVPRPPVRTAPLPSCPTCGSYALYRLPGGGRECQSCGGAI